jgi:hypothetical protein
MAEWTKDELLLANEQVLAATETRLKPGSALEAVYEATEDVAIEFACQRNLALWALNDVHDFLKSHGYDTTLIDSAIAACTEGK